MTSILLLAISLLPKNDEDEDTKNVASGADY